ncbi:MAG: CBS domain-containing protein [Woeseiaceae bacterium]
MMTLDTIMSTDLITISPDENLAAARSLLHERKIHHLPVVDAENKLIGLVTLTNVLAATDSFLRDQDNRIHAAEIYVKDIMVTEVATVDVNASLRQAALFLERHRIGCLPVMKDGELEGIITDTDFVGVAINLLEQLEVSEPFEEELDETG